ncbi:MAG TPA: DUF308 domain-containing protein [Allosphingosinicella sp.]|nr:DUF308 domain-containing protein [Allosphingosinicella sp.]
MATNASIPNRHWAGIGPIRMDKWQWLTLRGALALLLGIAAFMFPASALFAFTMAFAAFAFVDGLLSIGSGIGSARRKEGLWWTGILRGVVGVAVGVIFVAMPFEATIGYALVTLAVTAAWAIFTGILEMSAAIRLRKEIEGEWLLFVSGLLSVILGLAIPLLATISPGASLISAAWMLGAYAIAAGVLLIVHALRLRRRKETGRASG